MAISDLYATSREQLSFLFGVSPATVQKWAARGMPGIDGCYSLKEMIAWRQEDLRRQVQVADGDPAMVGDSPALERFREARAKMVELDLEERNRRLLQVDVVESGMQRAAKVLRDAVETLQREFGPEARDLIEGALDDFERIVTEDFSDFGSASKFDE